MSETDKNKTGNKKKSFKLNMKKPKLGFKDMKFGNFGSHKGDKTDKKKFSKMKQNAGRFWNRNKSNKDDFVELLSGTWEIEIPVQFFLSMPAVDGNNNESDGKNDDNNRKLVNNAHNVPMVQITKDYTCISLPFNSDMKSPQIYNKYLSQISLNNNDTKILLNEEPTSKDTPNMFELTLVKKQDEHEVILKGNFDKKSLYVRWEDGSSWSKITLGNEQEQSNNNNIETNTNQSNDVTNDTNNETVYNNSDPTYNDLKIEINELKQKISILKEKANLARSQQQSSMGQLADISTKYGDLEQKNKTLMDNETKLNKQLDSLQIKFNNLDKRYLELFRENDEIKNNIQYDQVQKMQLKLTQIKQENMRYKDTIQENTQQIASLQDNLKDNEIANKQYTKTVDELEMRIKSIKQENESKSQLYDDIKIENNKLNKTIIELKSNIETLKNDFKKKEILIRNENENDIKKLEEGFQETLKLNEKKLQELQILRNKYIQKNKSLTKDMRKLINQLEHQNSNNISIKNRKNKFIMSDVNDDDKIKTLEQENNRLADELVRKSQSLVDALRFIAEFADDPDQETKKITMGLSTAKSRSDTFDNNSNDVSHINTYDQVSAKLKNHVNETNISINGNSNDNSLMYSNNNNNNNNVSTGNIGSNSINNNNSNFSSPGNVTRIGRSNSAASVDSFKKKGNDFRNKMFNKMGQMRQKMIEQAERIQNKQPIKTDVNLGYNQLKNKSTQLQILANELSLTIEQKEQILSSLRITNTYLGKRVIALEQLINMKPGQTIENQDDLIRKAIGIDYKFENDAPIDDDIDNISDNNTPTNNNNNSSNNNTSNNNDNNTSNNIDNNETKIDNDNVNESI